MWSLIVFRFVIHLLISFVTFVLGVTDSCVTENLENGRCMSLNDCGLTADVLFTSPEAFNYAKNSKCGSGGSMVCCSSSGYKQNSKMIISTTPSQEEKIRLSTFSDSSVCGIHASSSKIQGGSLTGFEEFPWLAAMEYVSNYDHENKGICCGGSLISQRFVLSAAHCVRHHELVLVKVWLGATNISSDGKNCLNIAGDSQCADSIQKFNVKKTFVHSLYSSFNKMNDIGLIQLEHLVNFTSFIRPICLISSNSFPLRIQSYLIVSGWGATENSSSSDIKRKVSVPLQNNSACENLRTWEHNKISSEHLCAGGEPGRDSCPGDSGGPLMKRYRNAIGDIQWVQVGIVSFGAGCGVRGRPAVYVKVASYADWIVNVISDNGDSCKTPNEELAKCVPISDCRVILQAISSFQDDAIKFAKQSQCGHDESPLVCCGTVGTFIDLKHTITTERPRLYERPADPSYKAEPVTHLLVPPGSVCGRVSKKYRERAGKIAGPYEFPWVVTLQYKHLDGTPAGSLCSGSLINHRYVLTSATCLEIDGYNLASIHLGEWDFDKSGDGYDYYRDENSGHTFKRRQDYTIVETEAHPYFNKRSGNNGIALIRILETIAFDDYIRPICIPPKNFPPPLEHGPMETAGWNANADGFLIGKKLKAHHTAVSVAECDLTYPNFTYNFPNKICTRTADDSTIEDSGRPLVRRYEYDPTADEPQWFQEGILYKDKPENSKSKLVLYLRVARYHTWILNNLKKS